MVRTIRTVVLLCLALSLHAQSGIELDDVVMRAKFIFVGDVVRLGASTMATVPPGPQTAVVRVRRVLTGERMLGGFAGREITVTMLRPSRLENAAFFTNVTVYGDSVAAEEVVTAWPDGSDTLGEAISAAQRRNATRARDQRIARAAAMISGRVISVRLPQGMASGEHDPMWGVAVIAVDAVFKGSPVGVVEVLFPSSTDEMWRRSPKFAPGDEGVWILQRDQQERGAPEYRKPGLTALDPLDFEVRAKEGQS